jgi:hypothetical protein
MQYNKILIMNKTILISIAIAILIIAGVSSFLLKRSICEQDCQLEIHCLEGFEKYETVIKEGTLFCPEVRCPGCREVGVEE